MAVTENNQGHPERDDVIDAEIIAEQETEAPKDHVNVNAPTSGSSKSGRMGWVIAGFLLVFVGGLFAGPYVRSNLVAIGILEPVAVAVPQESGTAIQEIAALRGRVADSEQGLIRQQEMIAQLLERIDAEASTQQQIVKDVALLASQSTLNGGEGADQLPALKAEIARLTNETARLAALAVNSDPDVSVLNGQLAITRAETNQLKGKIAAMETVIADLQSGLLDSSPRGRLLVVLGRIKEQAQSGLSFGAELNSVQLDIATLPAVDQQLIGADFAILDMHADGILSFEALSREYNATARSIKLAQEKAEGGLLANLFTVRRTDDGATGIDAVLLEAERRLAVRDVAGAIHVLSDLDGSARTAAASWLAAAQAHTETLTALDRIIRSIAGRAVTPANGGQE